MQPLKSLTKTILLLIDQPYENYNEILPQIKALLEFPVRVETFENVLGEELPLTTARRAYRSAIKIAMGEEDVYREWKPEEQRYKKR